MLFSTFSKVVFLLIHPVYSEDTQRYLCRNKTWGLPLVLALSATMLSWSTGANFVIFHNLDTTEVKRRSFIPICSFALDSATFEKLILNSSLERVFMLFLGNWPDVSVTHISAISRPLAGWHPLSLLAVMSYWNLLKRVDDSWFSFLASLACHHITHEN